MKIRGLSRSYWRGRLVKLSALIWRRLLFRTTFIAITGSVGKTTSKELLAATLSSLGPTLASPGSSNGMMHTARTILQARPWHRFVVLEVATDRPGLIAWSALISRPDIAVILNVARTHTDKFPTLEDMAREKASLLRGLRSRGVAILNQDDPRVAAMGAGRKGRVVGFGLGANAAVRASDMTAVWPERLALTLAAGGTTRRVQTRLVGVHWTSSILGAVSAALECGVSLEQVAQALERVNPTPGRLDPNPVGPGAVILRDDYNGSLETFVPAFQVLREARANRKILAITTVSDSPEGWEKRLRRIVTDAASVVDVMIVVGIPRDTRRALKAAVNAGFPADRFHGFERQVTAAEFLRTFLEAGDLLLLRGKTTDHMGRLYHAQVREVRCWLDSCPKTLDCARCPELFGEPPTEKKAFTPLLVR